MKKVKLFKDPISDIKVWLNHMADQGYRLVGVKNFIYNFERSNKRYYYETQFIGNNPTGENKDYVAMLKESGKKIYRAPINQANLTLIKFRLRPLAHGSGKFANKLGDYNKEILIVESEEEEELLTNYADLASQYKENRNGYLQGFLLLAVLVTIGLFNINDIHMVLMVVAIVFLLWLLYLTVKNHENYIKYKEMSNISEN